MDSQTMDRDHARKLHQALQPSLGFLFRLRERTTKAGFPPDDKLYQLVSKAFESVHALSVELHYLSCEGTWRARKE